MQNQTHQWNCHHTLSQYAGTFADNDIDLDVLPELHRLEGEIDVLQSNHDSAQANFLKAMEVARQQDAKSLELRATMSLARLWAAQGESRKACDHLQPIFDWFTEGFETADLCDARQLLSELK